MYAIDAVHVPRGEQVKFSYSLHRRTAFKSAYTHVLIESNGHHACSLNLQSLWDSVYPIYMRNSG